MRSHRSTARFAVLIPVVPLVVAATAWLGPRWIAPREIIGDGAGAYVFWHHRVPRCLLAACAGAGLAVSGVVLQALFRNPLAEPYTLGVASGASLAAAIGFFAGWHGAAPAGIPLLSLLAFGGALGALALVFLMSRLRRERDMARLLLAGVCVAYLCAAGILLVTFLADRAITNDILVWTMGSLGVLRPRAALEIAVVLVPVTVLVVLGRRALDLLTLGDDLAATRGLNVGRTVGFYTVLVGLLTAVIVANCGPIGFVGLMVPHMGRALLGGRTLPLTIGSALLGAAFLAVCDGLARSLPVTELPVGVVTNILGAVFFFLVLATRDVLPAHRPS